MTPPATSNAVEVHDQLADVLDRVERGETLTLLRHGREVARLVPSQSSNQRLANALSKLMALGDKIRSEGRGLTAEELRQLRDEDQM